MVNGNFAGKYFVMAQQTKSTGELTPIQSLADEDYFIVQVNGGGTSLIKKSNLVLTPENVNFYALIKSVKTTNETLLLNSLSAVDTYNDLREIIPSTNEVGKLMYVRKRDDNTDDFNGNGLFQYRNGVGADNDGTVLTLPSDPDDPNPAVPSGSWERINISRVDVRWFGYGTNDDIDDNTKALQSAFDYAAANDIPVYIPPGTYTTYSLSANADLEITGKGTINFDNTNGDSHILVNTAPNVKISGIELVGSSSGTFGINASNSNKLILDGVTIKNFDTNVQIDNSKNIRISNSIITGGSTINIKCSDCDGGIITGNRCTTIIIPDPTDPNDPELATIHSIDVSHTGNGMFRITDNYGHDLVAEADHNNHVSSKLPVRVPTNNGTIIAFNNYGLRSGEPPPIFNGGVGSPDEPWTIVALTPFFVDDVETTGLPLSVAFTGDTVETLSGTVTLPVKLTTSKVIEGVITEVT
jgi:hypothetical protein